MKPYSPYPVPLRTQWTDAQGDLTRPWQDFFANVSRKAGRSVTWRGEYDDSQQYAVCDVVRLTTDGSLWFAKQAQPINGRTVTPGTDEDVWELIVKPGAAAATNGVPAGGTTGQVLTKVSGTDYDTDWETPATGGGVTLPIAESDVTGLVADLALKAPLASPTFTGDPKAPTPSPGDNDTSIATTAFVTAAVSSATSGLGSGTVTSVGLSMPAEFSVSGSPVTGSGTLSVSKGNQSANQVYAGPTTGSAAAPAFRALVAADIPAIAESGVTNLVTDLAAKAPTSRQITAGAGLTGGGDLSADRTISADAHVLAGVLGIVIDGGTAVPSTGSKGFLQCPYAGTITGWTLLADASGSCQITVKKSTYSGFPTTSSIVASAQPALSSAQKATSTTLTGWTTTFSAGDIFEFNLDSVSTCKRLILELQATKN